VKTRGLFPPRPAWVKQDERAMSLFEVGFMAVIFLTLVVAAAGAAFFGMPLGPLGFVIDFLVFFIGGLVLVFGITTSNDGPAWPKKLAALPIAPIGADGSVAVVEGTISAGPEGLVEAPLTKIPCVWSVVSFELTTERGKSRTIRRERLEKRTLFRIDTSDGARAFVDLNDGHLLLGFGSHTEISRPIMRDVAIAEGLAPSEEESVYASESRVMPGDKVFVVGIVRRSATGPTYRDGEEIPTIGSDSTTGLTISTGTREYALTVAQSGGGGRDLMLWGGGSIVLAALVSFLLRP
jgi:hypothetical protein